MNNANPAHQRKPQLLAPLLINAAIGVAVYGVARVIFSQPEWVDFVILLASSTAHVWYRRSETTSYKVGVALISLFVTLACMISAGMFLEYGM